MIIMEFSEFESKLQKFSGDQILSTICVEFGDVRKQEHNTYAHCVFDERHLSVDSTTFSTTLNLLHEMRMFGRIIDELKGILDTTLILRMYSVKDQRDGVHIPEGLISIEIRLGHILKTQWSLCEQPEQLLCEVDSLQDFYQNILKELNRDPNEPKFIIWLDHDPARLGDYESEVYKEVIFIGYEDKAKKYWNQLRAGRRFAGNDCDSYTYPHILKDLSLYEGYKIIVKEARPLSPEEQAEIDEGY